MSGHQSTRSPRGRSAPAAQRRSPHLGLRQQPQPHLGRDPVQPSDRLGVPECREAGKSKVELAHHNSAVRVFGTASTGQALADEAFTHGARWLVDITTVTTTGLKLANTRSSPLASTTPCIPNWSSTRPLRTPTA